MLESKNKEITRLNGAYGKILANAGKEGVQVIEGMGSLLDKETVQVQKANGESEKLKAKNILICVGGWPYVPPDLKGREVCK